MESPLDPPQFTGVDRLKITDGTAELEVTPAGGCITAFRWPREGQTIDWLRPAPPGAAFGPGDTGCFPLLPYSNRIRDGRYTFQGRHYRLTRNFAPAPHSIHGHGWKAPWQVADAAEGHLVLRYDHGADDWPSAYRAEQRFDLAGGALRVTLTLTNTGAAAMPAGLGLHPYFPRTPLCRLTAGVREMWAADGEVMPTRLVPPSPGANPAQGMLPERAALDNCFTGFSGQAVIDWPERAASLTVAADATLGFLVVFTPPGADFFCVEPVSHGTDAINRAAPDQPDSGMSVLKPTECFVSSILFTPRLNGAV
ncbi:MAG: aldose 1-epimerase [Kiloniellaceae bacterium]